MTRSTNTSIHFDKQEFLKTSKKLTKEIQEYLNGKSVDSKDNLFPLSTVQNLQAKAFGFRNTDAILKFFDKPQVLGQEEKRPKFLQDWSKTDIVALFGLLLETSDNNESWAKRAKTLIFTAIEVVDYLRTKENIVINTKSIQTYLKLDELIKIYKKHKDDSSFPEEVTEALFNYLTNLPGFQISSPKQGEITIEHHGFLQMQFAPILNILKQVEKDDVLIISTKWYRTNYCLNPHGDLIPFYSKKLDKNTLNEIYEDFPMENWLNYFQNLNGQLIKNFKDSEGGQQCYFTGFKLIETIKNHPDADDSWLKDDMYMGIFNVMVQYKELKDYYLSDLLLKSFSIIHERKRVLYANFIFNLLKSYNTVVLMSRKFDELSK